MNYIRKYNCDLIMNGITNHFDTLPDDIIELILKYNYPIEVYNSKNNELENKKKLLKELEDTVIGNTGTEYYSNIELVKLFKLDKKIKKNIHICYYKKLNNLVIKKNFYKNCINKDGLYIDIMKNVLNIKIRKNINKKHLLLLNDCGILSYKSKWSNIDLCKCICGDYCKTNNCNIPGNRYNWNKHLHYTKKHKYNITKIVKNEKKISEYGDKLRFCVDCNKPLKLESVKQHLNSNQHKNNCKY